MKQAKFERKGPGNLIEQSAARTKKRLMRLPRLSLSISSTILSVREGERAGEIKRFRRMANLEIGTSGEKMRRRHDRAA